MEELPYQVYEPNDVIPRDQIPLSEVNEFLTDQFDWVERKAIA